MNNTNTENHLYSNTGASTADTGALSGDRLWDEILKAIVNTMPEQLFPLFREAFGIEYPAGPPIQLLSTEHSTYPEDPDSSPSSRLMDIALLVAFSDFYHLECQMHNDTYMVLRMISYDLHFSLQHTASMNPATQEITLRFPRSVVIYPDQNDALPDMLRCHIIFPDQSRHSYRIPTVKIQSYTLEQIRQKHLYLFLPYTLLRLRPKLKYAAPLTKEELTAFVKEIIVILEEDTKAGYLTPQESADYTRLLLHASKHIFHKYPDYHEEVVKVTKPLIKLPSVELREAKEALDKAYAEIADKKAEIADKDAEIADVKATIAGKDAEIADKDAEIARLRQLLLAQGNPAPQG